MRVQVHDVAEAHFRSVEMGVEGRFAIAGGGE
jgi:hypothetical protein